MLFQESSLKLQGVFHFHFTGPSTGRYQPPHMYAPYFEVTILSSEWYLSALLSFERK